MSLGSESSVCTMYALASSDAVLRLTCASSMTASWQLVPNEDPACRGIQSCGERCRAVDFLIMEGQNLSAIAPSFVPLGGALGSARQAWVLIAAMVMLPTVYLRNLGLLAYLSAAGVLTSVSLTCLVGTIANEHGKLCPGTTTHGELSAYVPACLL